MLTHCYLVVSRLIIFASVIAGLLFSVAPSAETLPQILRPVIVYKSPTCGCCGAWVDHLEQSGFSTRIQHQENLNDLKRQLGVAPQYQACHTAWLCV